MDTFTFCGLPPCTRFLLECEDDALSKCLLSAVKNKKLNELIIIQGALLQECYPLTFEDCRSTLWFIFTSDLADSAKLSEAEIRVFFKFFEIIKFNKVWMSTSFCEASLLLDNYISVQRHLEICTRFIMPFFSMRDIDNLRREIFHLILTTDEATAVDCMCGVELLLKKPIFELIYILTMCKNVVLPIDVVQNLFQ